jgi:hypothetical protein
MTGTGLDRAREGDWLESPVPGGGTPRRGQILEVRGTGAHRRFVVRWDEQHESIHYPSSDDRIWTPDGSTP